MQTAKIEYKVTGDEPFTLLQNILARISIPRSDDGRVESGRAIINFRHNISTDNVSEYRGASKSFRKGGKATRDISFPLRIGNISYIDTIPASNQLTILFRHDSCMANNYRDSDDYDDDDNRVMMHNDEHHQPQFYFVVMVDTTTGRKTYKTVQSPWSVHGRLYPHNSSARGEVYSSNCAGGYGNQLSQSLRESNMGVFLSVFGDYIMNGTRINDDYGSSYEYFTSDVEPVSSSIRIQDLVQGKIMGHVMSDPEHPFEYDMDNQSRGLTFSSPEIEEIFYDTICRGRAQPEVTT